ncbi:Uncharacterised protein [Vibrio cholerae]|nr:Uncharacterised protein [Vibrio cholerae]CSI80826.1 Uncharacterised protein [Vibrio cholerae]
MGLMMGKSRYLKVNPNLMRQSCLQSCILP